MSAKKDETCRAFDRIEDLVDSDAINRFIVGEDQGPTRLSQSEAAQELGDPFATLLLLQGKFPRTPAELFTAIDEATADGDPLRSQMSFILGEGSQIPFSTETASLIRSLRFLVARGSGVDGPDVLLSAPDPNGGFIELMAWDRRSGGFNYYRTVGERSAWVWAGNSRHALSAASRGKGPFESHPSGNFIMKELRAPWVNWHSPDATIFPDVFAEDDPLRQHPWFTGKELQGALACEVSVARPSITRWTTARFEKLTSADGTIDTPALIMEQILSTPTVNLMSSHSESRKAVTSDVVDLPQTFFVDSEGLTKVLGLQAPPAFAVAGPVYSKSLETFDVRLTDDGGFTRAGDTHFAFVIPERAFEDQEVLSAAIKLGLITDRFAACLLMTDFPNPVFSDRRADLLRHVPVGASLTGGQSGFSEEMAEAIVSGAQGSAEGSPEREFAARWGTGEAWREEFNRLLGGYYAAITERLKTQQGFDDYFRLAESRRERVRDLPIFENRLLFARTNIPRETRVMRPDGTVETLAQS